MTKDEMKNRISMALKDPILQQGFEIICKNLAELETENNKLLDVINNQDVKIADLENKIADIKANCDLAIEGRDIKIKELEQLIEKMKRHCNCKHRDSEGYCEVKRTYLIDLSYDGCDKWELED